MEEDKKKIESDNKNIVYDKDNHKVIEAFEKYIYFKEIEDVDIKTNYKFL